MGAREVCWRYGPAGNGGSEYVKDKQSVSSLDGSSKVVKVAELDASILIETKKVKLRELYLKLTLIFTAIF